MKTQQMILRASLLAAVLALAACVSLEQSAPPVEMLSGGADRSTLQAGREIYITRCAKCHAVEPVTKYSLKEWTEIMPEMAEKTHLNPAETEAVLAYVRKAHQVARKG